MTALTDHIKALNAKTRAWVNEDPTNRFAGLLCEDEQHWAQYGITTPEQLTNYLIADLEKELDAIDAIDAIDAKEDEAAHKAAVNTAMSHTSGFNIGDIIGDL
jgi:hypothetical protein